MKIITYTTKIKTANFMTKLISSNKTKMSEGMIKLNIIIMLVIVFVLSAVVVPSVLWIKRGHMFIRKSVSTKSSETITTLD